MARVTAMVVDLKTLLIGEVHGVFLTILHYGQTLRTSLQDVQDVSEESAGGFTLPRRAWSKTADWDHLRAEQNGMEMARGEEGGGGRACPVRRVIRANS